MHGSMSIVGNVAGNTVVVVHTSGQTRAKWGLMPVRAQPAPHHGLSLSHVHVHVQSAWLCLSDVSGSNTCISRNTHSLQHSFHVGLCQ